MFGSTPDFLKSAKLDILSTRASVIKPYLFTPYTRWQTNYKASGPPFPSYELQLYLIYSIECSFTCKAKLILMTKTYHTSLVLN